MLKKKIPKKTIAKKKVSKKIEEKELIFKTKPEWVKDALVNKTQYQKNILSTAAQRSIKNSKWTKKLRYKKR